MNIQYFFCECEWFAYQLTGSIHFGWHFTV
jgi:hypothetical protein